MFGFVFVLNSSFSFSQKLFFGLYCNRRCCGAASMRWWRWVMHRRHHFKRHSVNQEGHAFRCRCVSQRLVASSSFWSPWVYKWRTRCTRWQWYRANWCVAKWTEVRRVSDGVPRVASISLVVNLRHRPGSRRLGRTASNRLRYTGIE